MKATCLILALILAGCRATGPTLEDAQAAMAQLDATVKVADLQLAELRAQRAAVSVVIDALPDGPEKQKAIKLLVAVETNLTAVQGFLAKAVPALDKANAKIQAATDGLLAAEAAAQAATTFIPAPWGWIAGLGVPLIFAVIRAVRNKQAGLAVAGSVNEVVTAALAANPALAGQLSIVQGAGGKAIVDQAQGGFGLPI